MCTISDGTLELTAYGGAVLLSLERTDLDYVQCINSVCHIYMTQPCEIYIS